MHIIVVLSDVVLESYTRFGSVWLVCHFNNLHQHAVDSVQRADWDTFPGRRSP